MTSPASSPSSRAAVAALSIGRLAQQFASHLQAVCNIVQPAPVRSIVTGRGRAHLANPRARCTLLQSFQLMPRPHMTSAAFTKVYKGVQRSWGSWGSGRFQRTCQGLECRACMLRHVKTTDALRSSPMACCPACSRHHACLPRYCCCPPTQGRGPYCRSGFAHCKTNKGAHIPRAVQVQPLAAHGHSHSP